MPGNPCLQWAILYTGLPADALGVVIHGNGQALAPFEPSALENLAPIPSFHPRTKTVYSQAAANLGLVRSFRRHARSFLDFLLSIHSAPSETKRQENNHEQTLRFVQARDFHCVTGLTRLPARGNYTTICPLTAE